MISPKKAALGIALWTVLALVACGDDGSTDTTPSKPTQARPQPAQSVRTARTEVNGASAPPRVPVPAGPSPKKLVVKDLRKGSGVVARRGQRLKVQYVAVSYETGDEFENRWAQAGPFSFNFGSGEALDGWETGLVGMRVGGRRELILPSRLAYGSSPLIYVIELLAIECARRCF